MEIQPIYSPEDRAGLDQFSKLAVEIYHADQVWVPQSEVYFHQAYASAQLGGVRMLPVICLENGQPMARAAAIFNPKTAQGSIGFFEHMPGEQAAGIAALAYCEEQLRQQGAAVVQALRVDNMWMGLLVKGFDLPQTVFTPHNLPEYQQTLLKSGYREVERLCTYRFTRASLKMPRLHVPGVRTRTFNRARLEGEIQILNYLQRHIFSSHAGYVPRTLEEDRAMITAFLPLLEDDLVIIAENFQDQAVGLLICLPDVYQAYKGNTVDSSARLISIGVLPDWKYKGSGALMVDHLVHNLLQKGYQSLEASWIKANNPLPQNLSLRFGGQPGREFALFEKTLTP